MSDRLDGQGSIGWYRQAAFESAATAGARSRAVNTDHLGLLDDVPGHRALQVGLVLNPDAGELLVEREQLEKVTVRFVGRAGRKETWLSAGVDAAFLGALGKALAVGGDVQISQWSNTPPGTCALNCSGMSGSSTMSARLWVLGGTLLNVNGGLTPSPSHEYFAGICPLSANAELVIFRSAAASPALDDTAAAHAASTTTRNLVNVLLQGVMSVDSLCYTPPP